MTTALWWIRRDLRLTDNQALAAALAHADDVIPVFVLDPTLLDSPCIGAKRVGESLQKLPRRGAYAHCATECQRHVCQGRVRRHSRQERYLQESDG
jgi:hypothetical protein